MMEGSENVIDDSLPPRNDEPNIPGTRLEPRSDKESPEVEITNDEEVEITNVVIPVNVNEEEEEITDEVYELKRREKGKIVEESKSTPFPTPIRSPRIHTDLVSSDTEKLQELTVPSTKLSKTNQLLSLFKAKPARFKRYKNFFQELQGRYTYLFEHRKQWLSVKDKRLKKMERMIAKAILQERGNIQAKISSQIQKAIDNQIPSQVDASVRSYMSGHILHVHPAQSQTLSVPEQQYQLYLSMKDNPQLQQQDIAIWITLHMKLESLQKTSEYKHRCPGESRLDKSNEEERGPSLSGPEAPALSLINQDLLYLKKGNFGPEKIVLLLHKFPAIIFNDNDIEERISSWVNKSVKKFNPYARYGVEHWKNPHAKIFYIRKQKEPGKPKKEIYSNLKIVQPDYKNLNKNDIEDIYLLIMNGKIPDYADTGLLWSLSVFIRSSVIWERVHDFQLGIESYQQKVNLTAPTITFPGIEEHDMFSIIYEPVHGIIYKNSKKEKRVMRHTEIHKFCDATLNRVLEGLKSYNNDVKYGYVQKDLTKDETEYLKLFEEEIEERLKHRRQMRRWEMYMNGRPLGLRRERPE
ncbi:hypothetical protein Tco_1034944 [Tanacetum coccineum]